MKIICTQENLKLGLAIVGRIISSSNTLPILNNILLKTENGILKIASTNLEIAITTNVRCRVETEGEVTVVSKTFIDLVNNMPNKNISLESSGSELIIEAENYHTKLKTLPADDFPLIPKVDQKKVLNIDAQQIKNSIDQVVFAASTNQTQPEISGVLFAQDGNTLKIVATDRYRLAEKKLDLTGQLDVGEVILPQKTILEISRIIGSQKGDLEIVFSETQAAINFNDTQIVSRIVDGQYPPYKQIIPTEFPTSTVLDKSQFISGLRAASVFGQSSNSVHIELNNEKQQVVLSSGSTDLGDSSVEISAKVDGPGSVLILNYHYLLDCLSGITENNVVIKTIDDNSPSLIVPEGKNDYIYLVMPIKS
jgi:DNA polymerase-3 subunit beta